MSAAFVKAYAEFAKFIREKNYDKANDAFLNLNIGANCARYDEHVKFSVNAAFKSIIHSAKNDEPKYFIHAINGFNDYLQAQSDDLEKYFTVLLQFANKKELKSAIPLLVNKNIDAFDAIAWLHSITNGLMKAIGKSKDNIDNERKKDIYLKLTQTFLVFMEIETQYASSIDSAPNYGESQFLLEECMELTHFAMIADPQYIDCFKLLHQVVNGISSCINGQQAIKWMINASESLALLPKKVRNTLVQDSYLVISTILHISYKHLTKTLTEDAANGLLMLSKSVIDMMHVIKQAKLLCETECNEDNIHACYGLYELSMDVASKIVQNNFNMSSSRELLKIIQVNMELGGKTTCKRAQSYQKYSVSLLKHLMKMGSTKSQANMLIPIAMHVLTRISPMPVAAVAEQMDRIDLLHTLWQLYHTCKNGPMIINIGYIWIACRLKNKDYIQWMEFIIHYITRHIQESNNAAEIATPHEFLTNEAFAVYALEKPADFNTVAVACTFFQHTTLTESNTFYEKYVNQMLEYAVANSPVESSRFLHYVSGVSCDARNTKLIETLLDALSSRAAKTKDPSLDPLYAKILYLRYAQVDRDNTQKFSECHISTEFTDECMATPNSVFHQFNFDMEVEQVNRLRVIKKAYTKFIDFYLTKEAGERQQFTDEKLNVLANGKLVANSLIMRGHLEHGLEYHWKVYCFAAAIKEEFTMIELCSCLAEHANEVQALRFKDDLNAALDVCTGLVIEHMKAFEKLGTTKQNHVLNYFLNLVIYIYETKKSDQLLEIHLLCLVIGLVGDIDEDVVSAIFGYEVDIKTVPNKAFDGVRFKIYATVFTMITKYNVQIAHDSYRLMECMLRCLSNNVRILNESTLTVAITALKSLAMGVMFCQLHYECTQYEPLVLTMLKYILRRGFIGSVAEVIYLKLMLELSSEKLETCTRRFNAVTTLIQNDSLLNVDEQHILQKNVTDSNGLLCEPIRKQGSLVKSPIRCISPRAKGKDFNIDRNYLLDHPTECGCALCAYAQYKYLLFRFACAHAWFVYLNDKEFSPAAKCRVFTELFNYWDKNRKGPNAFQKNDRFYLDSAQMLIWYSHYEWKFEKNYARSKKLLQSALKGLGKVRHYDESLRELISYSIESLDTIIDMEGRAKNQPNRKLGYDERQADSSSRSVQSIVNMTRKLNLLDMVVSDDSQTVDNGVRFQILDDEVASSSSAVATPASRKSKRIRDKKLT